jgi:hypothetical protein
VFATSTRFQGNFGALQADIHCADAAAQAQLPNGIYRAWISTMSMEPLDWLPIDAVWRLRGDDVAVAYSRDQLFSGTLAAPINLNEFGDPLPANVACNNTVEFPVWTGTSPTGMHLGPDCLGWSSNADMTMGKIGNAGATDMNWSAAGACQVQCSTFLSIYCFQQ